MKTITNQRDVLILLANPEMRLSIWEGKSRILKRDTAEEVARVQNGIAGKLVDRDLMAYNGVYELTDKGKARAAKLALDTPTPTL